MHPSIEKPAIIDPELFERAIQLMAVGFATAANVRSPGMLQRYGLLGPASLVWDRQPRLNDQQRSMVGEALFLWRLTHTVPSGDLFPIAPLPEPAGCWLLPADNQAATSMLLDAIQQH